MVSSGSGLSASPSRNRDSNSFVQSLGERGNMFLQVTSLQFKEVTCVGGRNRRMKLLRTHARMPIIGHAACNKHIQRKQIMARHMFSRPVGRRTTATIITLLQI